MVTATQANAASYKADLLFMQHFSEDKRKLAHANGIIGINVTAEEKVREVCRLNWVVIRERDMAPTRVVHCAGCLAIGNPAIRTLMAKKGDSDGSAGSTKEAFQSRARRNTR